MKKIVFFATFLTAIVASGLGAAPTNANATEPEKLARLGNISSTSDRYYFDAADNLNKIIGITGLGVGMGVIAYRLSRADKPSLANFSSDSNSLLLDRVSPKLRQKLLRLVHDEPTANRLLIGTMFGHAERSPNWLAEKVIYDLERDRL